MRLFCVCAALALALPSGADSYRTVKVEGEPFEMPPLREFVYPERRFPITDFGAKADGSKCTAAIAAAIARCNVTGGGYVVVPKGTFVTGKIHFKSNVNLRLEEGAVLEFTDEKADYLPAVHTTWEGVECWNTSPLVYAYGCENIAVTGPGTLAPRVEGWFERASPPEGSPDRERRRKAVQDACRTQYMWGSTNAPVAARCLLTVCPDAELRPQLIQMNRCRNVLLDGFRVRNSPFWCVHLYHSENVIARNLDMKAMRANNDAFDIDMTRNVLIENCTLENSDDGFCMKAGRNQDAWRLNRPTENVVVRNCHVKFAHTLLGIGSELSGGIRNVSLHDCTVDEVFNAFFVKTNCRRGGFVDNIHCRNVTVGKAWKAVAVDTDVMYQYRNFPTFEVRTTEIGNLHVSNLTCAEALAGVEVNGDASRKIRTLALDNVKVAKIEPEVRIQGWTHAAKPDKVGQSVVIRNVEKLKMDDCFFADENVRPSSQKVRPLSPKRF